MCMNKIRIVCAVVLCVCLSLMFFSCESTENETGASQSKIALSDSGNDVLSETLNLSKEELEKYILGKNTEYGVDIFAISKLDCQNIVDSLMSMCLIKDIENLSFTEETIGLLQDYLDQMETAISNEDTMAINDLYVHIYNVLNCTEYVDIKDLTVSGDDKFVTISKLNRDYFQSIEKQQPKFKSLSEEEQEIVLYLAIAYKRINDTKAAVMTPCERCKMDFDVKLAAATSVLMIQTARCALTGPAVTACCALQVAAYAVKTAAIAVAYNNCAKANNC